MYQPRLLNNRYQIVSTLGRGGFGETFLAIDTHLPSRKKCVIKQLKPIIQEPKIPQWVQTRFEQEARILEHLGQENSQIPCLYAYFSEGGNFYLVQEWIDGVTLTEKVTQEGVLSEQQVKDILEKILAVLDYVHSQKILHRDIKPDNIILRSQDCLPVLIDFGAVKEAMTTVINPNNNSISSIAIGTQGYMAPEQAAGRPIYSSDLYSLALTAVYLLSNKCPQELQIESRTGEILWREAAPHVHSNLATVIDRTLRFHPSDRISSTKEMLAVLQQSAVDLNVDSTAVTVAVLGKSSKDHEESEITQIKTSKEKRIGRGQEGQNIRWKPLLILLALFLVAIGSFIFGFRILLDQDSAPEVLTQPEDHTSPSNNNNNSNTGRERETEIESEKRLESNPKPQSKPPETVIENQPETPFQEQEKSTQESETQLQQPTQKLEREQKKREQELEREQKKREQELEREQKKREQELEREQKKREQELERERKKGD